MVHSSYNKLCNGADGHSAHEEDTATTNLGDYKGVDYDHHDADSGKDARVLESVADMGHLEKVCSIGWYALASSSTQR